MLDIQTLVEGVAEFVDTETGVRYAIAFRKASVFDSITEEGKRVARTFDATDFRFECTMKVHYLGCQRIRLDVSTRIRGFVGPSEEFIGTTGDEFEMEDGPIIRIGTITPHAVAIVLTPPSRT